MTNTMLGLLVTGFALLSLGASQKTEPLCQGMVCESNEECRVSKNTNASDPCIQPVCIPKPSSQMTSAGCIIGDPLLQLTGQEWGIVTCHPRAPCPEGFYCSTALMDVAARCCRSDADTTPKPGTCPKPDPNVQRFFCVDECLTDNDCHHSWKCCRDACSNRCTYVSQPHHGDGFGHHAHSHSVRRGRYPGRVPPATRGCDAPGHRLTLFKRFYILLG